ncbi:MAG: hypothetical protein SFX73_34685 [Kofleriaceae bacterium]|nr:hypothetical protein [Kofleriaceae bacterium]
MKELLALLVLASCTSTPSEERFVGTWKITGSAHPLEAVFDEEGRIHLVEDQFCFNTGLGCSDNVRVGNAFCRFADTWQTSDETTLVIDATCSDNVQRPLVFEFLDERTQNAQPGGTAVVLRRAGQVEAPSPEISPAYYDWQFQRVQ